jgi:ABC-type Fe3+/spermidine/putrescine transport system ATPase subunit
MREGVEVLFMVRPERLRLSQEMPDSDNENILRVKVTESVFLGDSMTYRVETQSGLEFRIKRAAAAPGRIRPEDSSHYYLCWAVEDTHCFDSWSENEIQPQHANSHCDIAEHPKKSEFEEPSSEAVG